MARPKKDGIKATYLIDRPIMEELDKFCEETGLSKTVAVERALKMFLDNYRETGKLKMY